MMPICDEARERYAKWLVENNIGTWESVQAGGEDAEKIVIELIEKIEGLEEEWAWRDCPDEPR